MTRLNHGCNPSLPSGTPAPLPAELDRLVNTLVNLYLDQLQAGIAADPSELIAAHPELFGVLDRRLALVTVLHRSAERTS